jgi:hypothetical protein
MVFKLYGIIEEKRGDGATERGRNIDRSIRADCTRSAIENKRIISESQLSIAVPAKISDSIIDRAQKISQNITFDADQGIRYKSELKGSDVRNTKTEKNEKMKKLA